MTENTIRSTVAKRGSQPPAADPNGAQLAVRDEQTWWSPRQLAALKALGIKHASQEDLLVFLHYCSKTKLDPFSKQVYMLERRSKENGEWVYRQTIVVGIDGYRVVAQRAAERQGCHLEYADTVWFDHAKARHEIWLEEDPPAGALVVAVKVFPNGSRLRYPGVARFDSYAARSRQDQSLQGQWAVMPDHMIEKCSEAFALRRAFPNDLGGTYVEEELQHAPPPVLPARRRPPRADDESTIQSHADDASAPGRPPGDQAEGTEPDDAEPDVKPEPLPRSQATKLMNRLFDQGGMSGKDNAEDRRAVVSYLLGSPELITFKELSDEDVSRAATELNNLVAGVTGTGGDIAEVLARSAAYYLTHDQPEATEPAAEQQEEDQS